VIISLNRCKIPSGPAPRSKLPGAAMSATVPPETGVHMGNVGYYNRLSWLYGGTGLDAA